MVGFCLAPLRQFRIAGHFVVVVDLVVVVVVTKVSHVVPVKPVGQAHEHIDERSKPLLRHLSKPHLHSTDWSQSLGQ